MKTKNYNDLTEIEQELFIETEKNSFKKLCSIDNFNELENRGGYDSSANENTIIYCDDSNDITDLEIIENANELAAAAVGIWEEKLREETLLN